jgi:hypothetical protein
VLTNLFGTAPEDAEVTASVRSALDAMKKAGAELVEVAIPGLDDQLNGSSVIDAEFKFDLMDYLSQFPNAPVKSLGDIIDRGLYHAELEAGFKRRNLPEARETDTYRRALVRRGLVRDLVVGAMQEQRVDTLAYPVMRRRPASIGEPQRGTNCQLSPSSGLPAISFPAGFTDDGVPIGVELMGGAWSEAQLLSLAYSYEQTTHPRRPPSTTPALVNGKSPAPVLVTGTLASNESGPSVRYSLRYDVVTGKLTYEFVPPAGTTVIGSALRRGANGAVVAVLSNPSDAAPAGDVMLGQAAQAAVRAGDVSVEVAVDRGRLLTGPVTLTK